MPVGGVILCYLPPFTGTRNAKPQSTRSGIQIPGSLVDANGEFPPKKSGDHLNKKTDFLWLGKVLSFIFKFLQFYSLILFYNTHINCYCISSHTAVISNMKCLLLILTSILSFYRQPFVHDFVGGTPASRRPTLHRGPVVWNRCIFLQNLQLTEIGKRNISLIYAQFFTTNRIWLSIRRRISNCGPSPHTAPVVPPTLLGRVERVVLSPPGCGAPCLQHKSAICFILRLKETCDDKPTKHLMLSKFYSHIAVG